MYNVVQQSAAFFCLLGVEKGNHVAILGKNLAMWLMANHGVQEASSVSAMRGSDTNDQCVQSVSNGI